MRRLCALPQGKRDFQTERELTITSTWRRRLRLLQAVGPEFLALLAVQALLFGLLRALDRLGAVRLFCLLGRAAAGVEVAGAVVVCPEAVSAKKQRSNSYDSRAGREIVIIEAPSEKVKGAQPRAAMMNRG